MSSHNLKRKSPKKSCKGDCSENCSICKKIVVIKTKSHKNENDCQNTCEKDKLYYKGIFNLGTRYAPCDIVYIQGTCINLGGTFKYIGNSTSIGVDPRVSSDWQVIALDGQCGPTGPVGSTGLCWINWFCWSYWSRRH